MSNRTTTIRISLSKILGVLVTAVLTVAAVVGVARSAVGASNQPSAASREDLMRWSTAAYRDGLFLGRFHASIGKEPEISLGRWGENRENRWLFMQGYEAGYRSAARDAATLP